MAPEDTQWPRFQVFLQEKEDSPHQDVGSVHASDPEMALQNARDVFVRRPNCVNIWVVRAEQIYARTAQQIASGALEHDQQEFESTEAIRTYCVFSKRRSAGTQTFRGEVRAVNPVGALRQALDRFSTDKPPFAWQVFPKELVLSSTPEDADSMFAPARGKSFRMATDFHTLTEMRRLLSRKQTKDDEKLNAGSEKQ
jgi:ring-1,2-phenylacetyl-CoA epoxidase subunit PaaB